MGEKENGVFLSCAMVQGDIAVEEEENDAVLSFLSCAKVHKDIIVDEEENNAVLSFLSCAKVHEDTTLEEEEHYVLLLGVMIHIFLGAMSRLNVYTKLL